MTGLILNFARGFISDLALLSAEQAAKSLTAAGWSVMLCSVAAVIFLLSFCLSKVLALPPVEFEEHVKGPLEIDTHDQSDAD